MSKPNLSFIKPELVADRVSENIRNGTPEPLGKILREVGYAESTALKPSLVTSTERFKRRLELQNKSFAKELAQHRVKALKAAGGKIGEAKYRDLVYGVDIMTKNERLLTGQATDNTAVQGSIIVLPSANSEFEKLENGSAEA